MITLNQERHDYISVVLPLAIFESMRHHILANRIVPFVLRHQNGGWPLADRSRSESKFQFYFIIYSKRNIVRDTTSDKILEVGVFMIQDFNKILFS